MDIVALDQAVATHLPDEFLMAAVKSIFLAKQLAHDHCKAEFALSELINVSNFYWRGKVQGLLRDSAERMPGFSASVKNASGWNHTEISCNPFTITAHFVDYPCAMVDDAKYRRSLAESQPSFFDPADVIPGAKLYALLVYSPYRGRNAKESAQYAFLPGSVYLAFPEAALKRYAHRINLFDKFPGLLEELLPKKWESEARLVYHWQAKQQRTA
jgi:hypothetical protein